MPADLSRVDYVLWLCDHCGDHAECEPGEQCEVCCDGTIEQVQVVPVARVEGLLSEVSRDYAGAHVNAGCVTGTVRKRLRELVAPRDKEVGPNG